MKKSRLVFLAFFVLVLAAGLIFWLARPGSRPVLVFKGYEPAGTNSTRIARLELQNTTRKTFWIEFAGTEFPLSPGFLVRPMVAPPRATNGAETNLYSFAVGRFFMRGERLPPGETLKLDCPLRSGTAPEWVGISCYLGKFRDGNDFIDSLGIQVLDDRAR